MRTPLVWQRLRMRGLRGRTGLAKFAAEVPDTAKMLQESGTRAPCGCANCWQISKRAGVQLLDPEAAKEKVRHAPWATRTWQQWRNRLRRELSQEMGISLQQAQQATGTALGFVGW